MEDFFTAVFGVIAAVVVFLVWLIVVALVWAVIITAVIFFLKLFGIDVLQAVGM